MSPRTENTKFGLITLVTLVVGNAIGAGIYTTSGFALADLGSREWVLLAWFVGGIIALCGAISYGMLAKNLTESGGEYLYLARNMHPAVGFLAGWVSMLAGFTGAIAFAATAFEVYAASVFSAWLNLPEDTLAVAVIVFGGVIHIVRTGTGASIHDLFVAVMILALIGLVAFSGIQYLRDAWVVEQTTVYNAAFNISAFAGSLVWISLSYSGFNAAVYVAGEARKPAVDVPRAMVIGTVIILFLYLALNAIFLYAPSPEQIAGASEIASIAAEAIGGKAVRQWVEAIIAISLLTSVTAMILAGPRVYAKMAEDGALPRWFKLREGSPPRSAILLQVAFALAFVLIADLRGLMSYLGFTLSLCLALSVSTLFLPHIRNSQAVKHWAYPVAPLLFVVTTLLFATLSVLNDPKQIVGTLVSVLLGIAIYYITGKYRQPK